MKSRTLSIPHGLGTVPDRIAVWPDGRLTVTVHPPSVRVGVLDVRKALDALDAAIARGECVPTGVERKAIRVLRARHAAGRPLTRKKGGRR